MYVIPPHIVTRSRSYRTSIQYYNRWANHEQSIKLSVELYAKTEKKMEEMQITSELTYIEVQFMRNAVDEVKKCRTTLKWTYAMAYYLEKGNQKELFEDNQRCVTLSRSRDGRMCSL
jgi:ariadne-1